MVVYANNDKNFDLSNLRARVDRIHFAGLKRTKDDFMKEAVKDVFKISNFGDLFVQLSETKSTLERLGCFKDISITLDTSSGDKSTADYGYEITFNVVELNKITGRMNTQIENNQGSLGVGVQFPNLKGRGEALQAEYKYNSSKMQTFNVSFLKPLLFNHGSVSSSIFKQTSENTASGCKLTEYGAQLGLSFLHGSYSSRINHNMEYEGVVRNVGMLSNSVAFPIRENAGYTLKSSIKNTIGLDTRDSLVFPTHGHCVQLKSEFAGLGGNIGFFKNELFSQINIPLISDFSLQASVAGGMMTETTKNKFYSIVDQFFIGGPLTLRGFYYNSVGPKVEGYARGGTAYWLTALHLYTPLPHRPSKGSFGDAFRIHLFCNAGNLTDVSGKFKEYFQSLSRHVRLSYGIGLVYRLGQIARVELNYCIPYFYQNDDKLIDGVQLGLGVQFM